MWHSSSKYPADAWIDAALIPVTSPQRIPKDRGDAKSNQTGTKGVDKRFSPVYFPAESKVTPDPALPRPCHLGCVGPDVHAYKRILRHLGIRPKREPIDREWHVWFTPQVKEFQKRHHLVPDGVIGPLTYRALFTYMDNFDKWLIKHTKIVQSSPLQLILQHALRSVALAAYWHYAEIRPYPVWEAPDHLPTTTDCSGHYGLMRKWAGAKSPYGDLGYSGYGNTDTLLAVGTPVDVPNPGDAILYADPGHVITCIKWPMGVSFGSEQGPFYMDVRYKPIQAFRRFAL